MQNWRNVDTCILQWPWGSCEDLLRTVPYNLDIKIKSWLISTPAVSGGFWMGQSDIHAAQARSPSFSQKLGLETTPPTSSQPLQGLACPLNKWWPELCVCYPASWETGSGIAKGLLWVNISLNLVLAPTTSMQSKASSSIAPSPPF